MKELRHSILIAIHLPASILLYRAGTIRRLGVALLPSLSIIVDVLVQTALHQVSYSGEVAISPSPLFHCIQHAFLLYLRHYSHPDLLNRTSTYAGRSPHNRLDIPHESLEVISSFTFSPFHLFSLSNVQYQTQWCCCTPGHPA